MTVKEVADASVDRIVMISFGLDAPEKLVEQCFKDLEDKIK